MPDNTSTRSHKYRADIDGLRAVAVLAVVGFHYFPQGIRGGFIGVDIFFVISGFLISTILFEQLGRGRFGFADFYARRVRRIFPSLLVLLTACLLVGWFTLLPFEYKQLGKHVSAGGAFVSNLVLWNESGYFDNDAITKPLLHLWSLGIEEQFYLVWPVLLWMCVRWNILLPAMLVIALVSFAINVTSVHSDPVAAFYSPQTRFWELAIGSIMAYMVHFRNDLLIHYRLVNVNVQSFVGATLLVVSLATTSKESSFPGWWALMPTVGTALVIAADQAWLNRVVLSNRALVLVGLISFPLYLYHWPLLVFAQLSSAERLERSTRIATVMLAFLLSWLTYKFIERPVRLGKSGYRSVAVLVAGVVAATVAGFAVNQSDGVESRTVLQGISMNKEVNDQFKEWLYTNNEPCLKKYPFKDAATYNTWFCMLSKNQDPTFLLLGSSYANQLYPGFIKNERLSHHTFLNIGLCDPASADEDTDSKIFDERPCIGQKLLTQQRFFESVIDRQKSIEFAVLEGLNREPDAAYIERLRKRIDFLEARGIQVIIFVPHLRLGFHPKACFSSPLSPTPKQCSFDMAARDDIDVKFRPVVQAISASNPSVRFFDQNDLFCDSGGCSMVSNGMPLARDYGHISEYGSVKLQVIFSKWAETNIPGIFGTPAQLRGKSPVQPLKMK